MLCVYSFTLQECVPGMCKHCADLVRNLLRETDVHLLRQLEAQDLGNLFFCHRSASACLSCSLLLCLSACFIASQTSLAFFNISPQIHVFSKFLVLISKHFGQRSFSHVSPSTWNGLPCNLRHSDSQTSFRQVLKIHLFQQSF